MGCSTWPKHFYENLRLTRVLDKSKPILGICHLTKKQFIAKEKKPREMETHIGIGHIYAGVALPDFEGIGILRMSLSILTVFDGGNILKTSATEIGR